MKIDYDKLASTYDNHRRGGGPYLGILLELARECSATRVLELGAGTGNNTQAFLDAHPCALVGLEIAGGMLERARAKRIPARWLRASADAIPLASSSFDFVFGCYFMHHVPCLGVLFAETRRVLRHGSAAFVTAPVDFIERHPMNRYFPSFATVDKARFLPTAAITEAMTQAGFRDVRAVKVAAEPKPIDRVYVERVANKFISTYALLPEDEFETGLKRLRADIEPSGRLDVEVAWEALVVTGYS